MEWRSETLKKHALLALIQLPINTFYPYAKVDTHVRVPLSCPVTADYHLSTSICN